MLGLAFCIALSNSPVPLIWHDEAAPAFSSLAVFLSVPAHAVLFALVERRAAQSPEVKGDRENAKHSDQAEVNAFERGGRKAFKLT
ncbi:hypothetical protein [Methylovirgula sp. HY1]|uniref:hypothetical protein n=1 Tax=Methylovirgula sp. HY1 TaxID=2822761 RepID=UPI001C5ADFAE|nr:hypothetical protein [Methylovirgula sp. HY1]